jgi:hypothetical protein
MAAKTGREDVKAFVELTLRSMEGGTMTNWAAGSTATPSMAPG